MLVFSCTRFRKFRLVVIIFCRVSTMVYEIESTHFSDFFQSHVLENARLRFGNKFCPRLQACIVLKPVTTLQLLIL
jgi:hypothetical protein